MSVILTYDPVLSRVRITADGLAGADLATVERSTNGGLRWYPVRGALAVPVTAGALASTVDDYEFPAGLATTYRVRGRVSAPTTFVGAGAAASGDNTSLVPALPAGLVAGDLVLVLASVWNSGLGTVDTPADWTQLLASGNVALLGRVYDGVWTAPTITFTGSAPGADTIAQCAAWRGADLSVATSAAQLNLSAQDIAYPGAVVTIDGAAIIYAGWKQDDWTSVATITDATEIGEPDSTAGNDAGQVWDYQIQTTATDVAAGSFVVTGGVSAISRGAVVVLPEQPYLNEQTAVITPVLTSIWLKSVKRPFLNRAVTVAGWSDVIRPSRYEAHDVVGRSYPVAVTDLRSSKQFTLSIYTGSRDSTQVMDYVLAAGDVMFLHTPDGCEVPGGYICIGDTGERRPHPRATSRVWTLPCKVVAPPGPDVVAATATWAAVVASYATWDALLDDNPTWADLLELIADPATVIVA